MHKKVILTTLLVAVTIVASSLAGITPVHAPIVGVVCIAPKGTVTSGCPATPVYIPASPVGTNVTIAINIQGSDALNGFRIYVKTDNTILNPRSADFANSLLGPSPLVLAKCINGAGSGCDSANDGPGVVDVAAVTLSGLTTPPTTGGLFEIVYTSIASTQGTPATFLTGSCSSGSSVPGQCVTITNGGTTPDPETSQDANVINQPSFVMSASPSAISVGQGSSGSATVTATSLNGFVGTVSIGITATPSVTYGPTGSLKVGRSIVASISLTSRAITVSGTLTVATQPCTPTGLYIVTVTGTSGSILRTASVNVTVTAASMVAFCITASPSTLHMVRPGTNTTIITVTSANGFNGTVALSVVTPRGGPAPVLSTTKAPVSLISPTATATLTLTTSSKTLPGTYIVTVTGKFGKTLVYSVPIPVTVT